MVEACASPMTPTLAARSLGSTSALATRLNIYIYSEAVQKESTYINICKKGRNKKSKSYYFICFYKVKERERERCACCAVEKEKEK